MSNECINCNRNCCECPYMDELYTKRYLGGSYEKSYM